MAKQNNRATQLPEQPSFQRDTTEDLDPNTGEVRDTLALDPLSLAALPESDLPLLGPDNTVQDPKKTMTQAGFFPLDVGNSFTGFIIRDELVQSQFGRHQGEATVGGKTTTVNMQRVFIGYGTSTIKTKAGAAGEVRGYIMIPEHDRNKGPLEEALRKRVGITAIHRGQQVDKTKKDGTTRQGAHMWDVCGVKEVTNSHASVH